MSLSANQTLRQVGFSSPVGTVVFEFDHNWRKLDQFMKYMGGGKRNRGIKRDLAKAQRNFLNQYKKEIIRALQSEGSSAGMPFDPHKESYKGGSSIGIRSRVFLDALYNLKIKQKGYSVSLTYSPSDLHKKSFSGGDILSRYAMTFEMGNKKGTQVARPVWGAAFKHMGGTKKLIQYMHGAVGKRLTTLNFR